METVLSGIRPTGKLHLGNYFGAVKNFVKMQEENNCYFFVADYHSLTTHPKSEELSNNVKGVLSEYIASGLDPEKCTLYIQSDLPETAELYLFMNMFAYMGELSKVTSFKDKARKHPNNINAGLLTYPCLQAADILIHRAHKVPVGKDQEQHLEMTRKYARRFNNLYGVEYLPEPDAYNFGDNLVKIPGLDGSGKMGKSEGPGNALFLTDEPEMIIKKLKKAKTDAGPTQNNQEKSPEIENLFTIMKAVSKQETLDFFLDTYNNCSIRYGDFKKQIAEDVILFTEPIRERYKSIISDDVYLKKTAEIGAEKARISAKKTIKEVRDIIGLNYF